MRSISVELSRTVNLGNYESLRVQASFSVDLNNKADIEREYDKAWKQVEDQVADRISEYLEEQKK